MSGSTCIAAGIDLGGTKIEAQVFAKEWSLKAKERWPTPKSYTDLVAAIAHAIHWCEEEGGKGLPVGIAAAGLINPETGRALTANLPATGKPFPADIAIAAGRQTVWINDCRALALSEAALGAAKGADPVVALIFGTGVAGGAVTKGRLMAASANVGGEYGHFPLAAAPMIAHGLPVLRCGCGRLGCAETYLSGPGLARICKHVTGQTLEPEEIVSRRTLDPAMQQTWDIWLDLATEFLITLCFTLDPQVIVLGGGLSRTPGLADDLTRRLREAVFAGFPIPAIRLAEGGDASGARGAALHALSQAVSEASHV